MHIVKHHADNFNKIQASTMVSMRSLLLWDVTQHWLLIGYKNFGTIYWPHLPRVKQSNSPWPASPLKKVWWVVLKHPQPITSQHRVTYQNSKDLDFNRSSLQARDTHTHTHPQLPLVRRAVQCFTCDGRDYKNYCLLGCDNVRLVEKYQYLGHAFSLFTLDILMILLP